MCAYVLIAYSSKNLCGIAQLDAGYVTVCYAERTKLFSGIAWPGMGGWGCYTNCMGSCPNAHFINRRFTT
jgi:hypothetical protein